MGDAGHEHAGGFEEIGPDQAITAFGDPAGLIDFARGIAARRQPEVGADASGSLKAAGITNRGAEGRGIDGADFRNGHEAAALLVVPGQAQEPACLPGDLPARNLPHRQEWTNRVLRQRLSGDEFLDPPAQGLVACLCYEKGDPSGRGTSNNRNGHGKKRVLTESGSVEVAVPRDRDASFSPQLVKKAQSRLPGFDEKVILMCGRGMTQREILGHLDRADRGRLRSGLG